MASGSGYWRGNISSGAAERPRLSLMLNARAVVVRPAPQTRDGFEKTTNYCLDSYGD
jgi:hypothetical protein